MAAGYPTPNQSALAVAAIDREMRMLRKLQVERISDEPTGLSEGVPRTFFVDSGSSRANALNTGLEPYYPFATVAQATGAAEANRGDTVYIMAGHAETYSAAYVFNKAGVTYIGLGTGPSRPTFTSATSTGAKFQLTAVGVVLVNLLLVTGIDSQAIVIDVDSTDCEIVDVDLRASASAQYIIGVDINGGGANACDRTKILGGYHACVTAGASESVELGEVADGVVIDGLTVYGDFADACIHNPTGKVLTNLTIKNSILTNLQTGDHSIELVSACTGLLAYNLYKNDMTQATGTDPGSCFSFQCFHDDVIDTNGILCPAGT